MITQLIGRLVEKSPTEVVIDCNGVGYMVHISLYTFSQLSSDENIKLFTHLQVKEDSHTLAARGSGSFQTSRLVVVVVLLRLLPRPVGIL